MSDCLFCDLISERKAKFLYEDEQAVAFADISPKAPTHLLIVPKKHLAAIVDITEVDEALVGHLHRVAIQLAKEYGLNDGFRLITNTGPAAGQTIPHLHIHLLAGKTMTDL